MRQRILIANDDGINAKGLRALIEAASHFGDIVVVAPETGMSGMSHAITMSTPIYLRTVRESETIRVYACHGTPADCIKVAVDYLMEEPPTLILSGINHGSNSNICSIYSGTIGAAMEGSMYNIPSIGFSLESHSAKADFTAATKIARKIIETTLNNVKEGEYLCLNVNIPNVPYEEVKGIVTCPQAMGVWKENFVKNTNPRGMDYFWLTGDFYPYNPEDKNVDVHHLANNYVTVVPLQPDMTNHKQLEELKNWGF